MVPPADPPASHSGVTPGTFALMAAAAARTSAQVLGCHGTGKPALRNIGMLYQSALVFSPWFTP